MSFGYYSSKLVIFVLGRNYDCVEIPATHIQVLNLNTKAIKLYPWNNTLPLSEEILLNDWQKLLKIHQSLPDDEFKFDYDEENLSDEVRHSKNIN